MSAGRLQVLTPSPRDIVLRRRFDAPRHRVFDALTVPELLVRWYGAKGWNLVECDVDLRVGGRWRFVSEGPDGARMGQHGVYREVVRPERLVYTEVFDDQSYPGEALVSTVLTEVDGRTTMTGTVTYPSAEARDRVLRYPMADGVAASFDRLDVVLHTVLDAVVHAARGDATRDVRTGEGT